MSLYDRKYREGVRAYILSLDPKEKQEFEYRLYQDVNAYRKRFREAKESLKEAVEALAFLQSEMYVIPFKAKPPEPPATPLEGDSKGTNGVDKRKAG